MDTVDSQEARIHFSALLERVVKGVKITITKNGTPVAMLVPVDLADKSDRSSVIEAIKELRKGRKIDRQSLKELVREGRCSRSKHR